jgi:hypothetical protein
MTSTDLKPAVGSQAQALEKSTEPATKPVESKPEVDQSTVSAAAEVRPPIIAAALSTSGDPSEAVPPPPPPEVIEKDALTSKVETPAPKTAETLKADQPGAAPREPAATAPVTTPEPPKPVANPDVAGQPPVFTPTTQTLAVSAPSDGAVMTASEGHGWGLGLFSGKLIPSLKSKFHHTSAPMVHASCQASPQSLFPQTYFECEHKVKVAMPAPQMAVPTPQQVIPSSQCGDSILKKKCDWFERKRDWFGKKCDWFEECKVIRAIKDWKAQCKIKMCPCCSGGHRSPHCTTGWGVASPQGSAPICSPQARPAAQAQSQTANESTRPESGDLAKREDVVQRVSADGVDESPKR